MNAIYLLNKMKFLIETDLKIFNWIKQLTWNLIWINFIDIIKSVAKIMKLRTVVVICFKDFKEIFIFLFIQNYLIFFKEWHIFYKT